ncbi:MAG: Hsp20/alpha crystallin family protein [Bacteroidales bacterium]|nr:Hsp20/alpha crystallin family protein [Bacteroidales bacterium]
MTIIKYFRPDRFSYNGNEEHYMDNASFRDLFYGPDMENTVRKIPEANVYEAPDAFRIEMALPGIRKSNIKISLDKQVLSIGVDQQENTEGRVTLSEFDITGGKRSFMLSESINTEKISSRLENGILSIILPKKESAIPKGPMDIQIN